MTDVVIAGVGQTPVGEHWNTSLRELALQAIEATIQDAGGIQPQALFVSNILSPTISGQAHLGALIADFAGLAGIEAVTVEGAGASGGLALRQAYMMVAAGAAEAALVVGVEKLTDKTGSGVEAAISTAVDSDYEAVQGLTPTAQSALLMRRYMHEFDVSHDNFAGFPVVAHANGVSNPNAMFRRAIKVESYQRAGFVSEPLNMFDVAPGADGSAAVLLTRRELLPTLQRFGRHPDPQRKRCCSPTDPSHARDLQRHSVPELLPVPAKPRHPLLGAHSLEGPARPPGYPALRDPPHEASRFSRCREP